MPVVSTIAEAAKHILQILDLNQDVEELRYLLSAENEKVEKLQDDLRILAERSQQNKETALKLKRAEYKDEMARIREAHADLAESQITAYVERELNTLGATEALKCFKSKREERRQEVKQIFRCDKDRENGSRVARATKRRQAFDENVARDEEKKKKKCEKFQWKWARHFDNVMEKKKEKEIKALEQKRIIAEEEEKARINAHTPEPAPKQGRLDKEKMPIFSCRQERDLWWASYYWIELVHTEADEEVDIPSYGSAEATYTEGRQYPRNWEQDRPEQFVEYVYPPPPPPPVAIEVITLD